MKSTETITSNKAEIAKVDVALRRIPYPYKAMLAICSDLDETPDKNVYLEIMRFLNTTEETSIGKGVGLEVGNSIYFDMPQNQFAYWNTDDAGREMVRSLIKSGHIDCLHSYGDLATKRRHAEKALDELDKYDCRMQVWVDHGTAPTNFGSDIMQGHGDEPGHQAYHADLTCDYGIKYIWRGRVTSITGQDVPASLSGIWNIRHPLASGQTLLKEITKRKLAQLGNEKYSMHQPNKILRKTSLRDGREVYEFMRSNPHWGGPGKDSRPEEISEIMKIKSINRLMNSGGAGILYTHLGKIGNYMQNISHHIVDDFRIIGEMFNKKQLLVCTTKRLLQYIQLRDSLRFSVDSDDNQCIITINNIDDSLFGYRAPAIQELDGITFKVPKNIHIKVLLGDKEIATEKSASSKYTYITVPWSRITWPDI